MELWNTQLLEGFLLAFLRIGTAFAFIPVFGSKAVPRQVKIGLSFILALVVSPVAADNLQDVPAGVLPAVAAAGSEVLVGLLFGLVTSLILVGAHFAGTIIGLQMGFAIVNIVDPQSGQQSALIGVFKRLLALTIFVTLDYHLHYITMLKESFDLIPLGGIIYQNAVTFEYAKMTAEVFVIAIKLAAPVMAILYLTEISLGIIARAVPQMNVFIVGFPLKIGVGLISLALAVPLFLHVLTKVFVWFEVEFQKVLIIMSGI